MGAGAAAVTAGLSDSARRQLAWWLGGCSAWVFAMVVIGGITRLTRSGLSMTDWKFTGEQRPITAEDWEAEFAKYKQSPEFKRQNSTMTVDEFKHIYFWEYGHRMWGRALGVIFAVPGAYFLARGYISKALGLRLGTLFAMGGCQGLIGWWMVKSGLEEETLVVPENPKVSPYRLAAHLTSAFAIYSGLVWQTLNLAMPESAAAVTLAAGDGAAHAACAALKGKLHPLAMLVGVTALSGCFVAGLQAGLAYNTFPDMNGQWIPDEYMEMEPKWKSFFESTATVQFHHRVLALTTAAVVAATSAAALQTPLPAVPRRLVIALAGVTGVQVALGITALLTYVPVSVGSAHQAGALTLFTVILGLMHSVRRGAGGVAQARAAASRLEALRSGAGKAAAGAAVL